MPALDTPLAPAPSVPVIPETAPFTPEQRMWLNGFLAGLFSRGPVAAAAAVPPSAALKPLTILFGSQTGTAEMLAKRAAKEAGKRGFAATVMDMAGFAARQLAQEQHVLVITSTHGEGEPPDNAKALLAALTAPGAPRLESTRFSVCGLGDTNYTHFCQAAKDFDSRLAALGGCRTIERADCDVDYEEGFKSWLDAALEAAPGGRVEGMPPPPESVHSEAEASLAAVSAAYGRSRPFSSTVLVSRNLNGDGSAKRVHHVELSIEGSGLVYNAGDALGVFPHNCPELVSGILAALGCDGEEEVPAPDGGAVPLRRALAERYCLGKPTEALLSSHGISASASGGPKDVLDVVLAASFRAKPADFVRALRRIQPRLYSIASSPKAHPNQVHLAVGAVTYEHGGRTRKGACSTFLADRVVPGQSQIGVFVHANTSFRPPASLDAPMIMIGPGTGIAPFRGFLQDRRASGARGRNWLFFGDQSAATDFLYREELAAFEREGLLTRLDTAFSRDQAQKVYVQHRMLAQSSSLYAWLEEGAHVYVCGDASRMAKDVEAALCTVIEQAGSKSPEDARAYLQALRASRRYCRDVY